MVGGISFGGLVSGLNTDNIIEQIIAIESRPISLLLRQKATVQSKVDAFKDLNTKLAALEDKAFALTQSSSVIARKATSADKNKMLATASSDASVGSFDVEIVKLASATTKSTLNTDAVGQGNGFGGIAEQSLAGADTVSVINTGNKVQGTITEGNFFVNGQSILVTNASTLSTILTDITTALGVGGSATLINDAGPNDTTKGGQRLELRTDIPTNVTLTAGTSNFLSIFKLDTSTQTLDVVPVPDQNVRTSTDDVNGVNLSLKMDDANNNFAQVAGSGTLTLNGVPITYNGTNDTLNDIISRINSSEAGVNASYSSQLGGRFILTNQANGPLTINVSDTGNLADTLGIGTGGVEDLGESAEIKINGGPSQFFNNNTGLQPAGLPGITLDLLGTAPAPGIKVTVEADTDVVVTKAEDFIKQYNSLVEKIRDLTKFDPITKQAGLLLGDSTITGIQSRVFSILTSSVTGLSEGTTKSGTLTELGFNTGAIGSEPGTTTTLQLDAGKLRSAVTSTPNRVAQIFGAADTEDGNNGIFTQYKSYFDSLSNSTGTFAQRQKIGRDQIEDISDRITQLDKRLNSKRAFLEAKFAAMEKALLKSQGQQSSLSGLLASIGGGR